MKRVLVTGASGFLGSAVTEKLCAASGWEVHAATHQRSGNASAICHRANLLEASDVSRLIEEVKPTHLLHLAWETRPNVYGSAPENVGFLSCGLHLLREFVRHGGQRFVSAGTCNEYDMRYGVLHEEETPAGQDSLYGITKRSFYSIASRVCRDEGLSYACGRIFFLYGERDKQNRAVPYAIRSFLRGEPAICQAADAYRDYMHVDDGADAFLRLLEGDFQGAVNVASGVPVAMGDIFSQIADQMDARDRLTLKPCPGGPDIVAADIGRLRQELGFVPRISLTAGIARTIAYERTRSE